MTTKNTEVLKQIELMLADLKTVDKAQYNIIVDMLKYVFLEYSTAKNQSIEKKLYDSIEAEIKYQIGKK